MTGHLQSLSWFRSLRIWTAVLGTGWTLSIALLLGWEQSRISTTVFTLAVVDADASFNRDLGFRRWAARHGGVYVPVTPETPPNPLLAHVPERDIKTPSGRELTLLNSAYISRQFHEWYQRPGDTRGHVTSLKPLRPENAPDEWEINALKAFENGEKEVVSEATIDGKKYVRLMRPLLTEEACLKCHAAQGYKIGDIRGGTSVSVPMAKYAALGSAARTFSACAYSGIWLIGIVGIMAGSRIVRRKAAAQQAADEARLESERERTRLSDQLLQAQKLESIGRLAGGIAHDFNNMILPVMGYTELLLSRKKQDDAERPMLQEILDATLRARDLTQQLLACGRRQPLIERPMDLNATIKGFESALRQAASEKVAIELRLESSLAHIRGDFRQIEQILLNLVINARDAITEGGRLLIETRNVAVTTDDPRVSPDWPAGAYVLLCVSDTGSGMDEETARRIFEPFFTTKKAGKGTGLGLSTVYGIVKQHGGQIEVDSELGRGTTFRVYFPRAKEK